MEHLQAIQPNYDLVFNVNNYSPKLKRYQYYSSNNLLGVQHPQSKYNVFTQIFFRDQYNKRFQHLNASSCEGNKKIYKKELFTPLVNIYPKKYYGNCYASCKSKSFINLFKVNSDGLNKKNELYHTEKLMDVYYNNKDIHDDVFLNEELTKMLLELDDLVTLFNNPQVTKLCTEAVYNKINSKQKTTNPVKLIIHHIYMETFYEQLCQTIEIKNQHNKHISIEEICNILQEEILNLKRNVSKAKKEILNQKQNQQQENHNNNESVVNEEFNNNNNLDNPENNEQSIKIIDEGNAIEKGKVKKKKQKLYIDLIPHYKQNEKGIYKTNNTSLGQSKMLPRLTNCNNESTSNQTQQAMINNSNNLGIYRKYKQRAVESDSLFTEDTKFSNNRFNSGKPSMNNSVEGDSSNILHGITKSNNCNSKKKYNIKEGAIEENNEENLISTRFSLRKKGTQHKKENVESLFSAGSSIHITSGPSQNEPLSPHLNERQTEITNKNILNDNNIREDINNVNEEGYYVKTETQSKSRTKMTTPNKIKEEHVTKSNKATNTEIKTENIEKKKINYFKQHNNNSNKKINNIHNKIRKKVPTIIIKSRRTSPTQQNKSNKPINVETEVIINHTQNEFNTNEILNQHNNNKLNDLNEKDEQKLNSIQGEQTIFISTNLQNTTNGVDPTVFKGEHLNENGDKMHSDKNNLEKQKLQQDDNNINIETLNEQEHKNKNNKVTLYNKIKFPQIKKQNKYTKLNKENSSKYLLNKNESSNEYRDESKSLSQNQSSKRFSETTNIKKAKKHLIKRKTEKDFNNSEQINPQSNQDIIFSKYRYNLIPDFSSPNSDLISLLSGDNNNTSMKLPETNSDLLYKNQLQEKEFNETQTKYSLVKNPQPQAECLTSYEKLEMLLDEAHRNRLGLNNQTNQISEVELQSQLNKHSELFKVWLSLQIDKLNKEKHDSFFKDYGTFNYSYQKNNFQIYNYDYLSTHQSKPEENKEQLPPEFIAWAKEMLEMRQNIKNEILNKDNNKPNLPIAPNINSTYQHHSKFKRRVSIIHPIQKRQMLKSLRQDKHDYFTIQDKEKMKFLNSQKNRLVEMLNTDNNVDFLREFIDKVEELKNAPPDVFSENMAEFIDNQVDSTHYAFLRKKELRMNEFIHILKQQRKIKESLKKIRKERFKFVSPIQFRTPPDGESKDNFENSLIHHSVPNILKKK